MADPTLAELAARLAVIEAKLGIGPVATVPATPTGLKATTLADGRIQLDWNPDPNAQSWDVLDLLNLTQPVKETVTVPRSIRSAMTPGDKRSYAVRARNAAGVSLLSNPLVLPSSSTPAPPTTGAYPADVVGPNWYLTIPVVDPATGWAMMIRQPTLAQYVSKYFELDATGKAAVFRCWHGGATTSGSKNPRSELREMADGTGKTMAAWSTTSGRHRMVVEGQVNRLTKVRPHVVIGQIHSATDDVTVFRVEGSNLWITNGNDPHGYLLDASFSLGARYQIGFDVSGGEVSFLYNQKLVPYTVKAATEGNYFKAGAYLQSNPTSAPGESTSELAEVVVYSVAVTHT